MPFVRWRLFQVGKGKGRVGFSGNFAPDLEAGASAIAGETTLNTVVLPANSLFRNGFGLRVRAWGALAANGNNKQVKLYLGTGVMVDSGVIAINNKQWEITAVIFRSAVGVQIGRGTFSESSPGSVGPQAISLTQDETTDLAITCKGTAPTGAADITSVGLNVEVLTS